MVITKNKPPCAFHLGAGWRAPQKSLKNIITSYYHYTYNWVLRTAIPYIQCTVTHRFSSSNVLVTSQIIDYRDKFGLTMSISFYD